MTLQKDNNTVYESCCVQKTKKKLQPGKPGCDHLICQLLKEEYFCILIKHLKIF